MSGFEYSKKNQRQLRNFFAEELTYDYQFDFLDTDRKLSFDQEVKSSVELQNQIQKLQKGISYSKELSEMTPNPYLVEQVMHANAWFTILLQRIRYDEWPVGVKLGLETLLIAVVVSVISVLIPWNNIYKLTTGRNSEVILAEISRELVPKDGSDEISPPSVESPKEAAEFSDENLSGQLMVPSVQPSPMVQPQAPTTTIVVTVTTLSPLKSETTTTMMSLVVDKEKAKGMGELWRGEVSVSNVQATTAKLVEKLSQLGGRKAGQVELGWKRKEGGTYFHFTIPQAKLSEMESLFNEFGKLKIGKEKHDRVMPDGIMRVIINVDEAPGEKKK